MLALGALALPAGLLVRHELGAEEFQQTPLPTDAARADPLDPFWDRMPAEFPGQDGLLYFNTAGLGVPPFEVLQRVQDVALEVASGGETLRAQHLEPARAAVARLVGADPAEIALTRNCTEAMNLVARSLSLERRDEVILTTHEHPGGSMPWLALSQDTGIVLRLHEPLFDADRDVEAIFRLAGKRTRVIVLSHVLSTVGYVTPVAAVSREARRRDILCVVDGAQAAGILPLDLHALGPDFYVASGHKWILGPVETGLLYVRRDLLPRLRPRFAGAYTNSENGFDLDARQLEFKDEASKFEYGTRSAAQAAGLGAAIAWQEAVGLDGIRARACALAKRLHTGIASLPGIEVLTPAVSVESAPIVTFRVTRRPNTQVAEWFKHELGMRVRMVGERNLNAVRASTHLTNRVADVDWLIEGVRALGA
jgi:selenocysteine lyase/cysteine desulfurase